MEYQPMRRADKQLEQSIIENIINEEQFGILSTVSNDNQPYGVPMSFVYKDNAFYFHSAITGHKLNNIEINNKVSFTIVKDVALDTSLAPKQFTTKYKSVIAFGTIEIINNEIEKMSVFKLLIEKYFPQYLNEGMQGVENVSSRVEIFKMEIEHITGKGHI